VAQYSGNGDLNDAANYRVVKPALNMSQHFPPEILRFFGPDNQKFYRVETGRLVTR
jgi:feruloyl esterase